MVRKQAKPSSPGVPTIQDVARRAGVSLSAVSFVLNEKGQRNRNISEATRAKVLQAIQELDYHPHMMARILGKGQSNEIICLYDETMTLVSAELFSSAQQQAIASGLMLVSYSVQGMSEEQRDTLYRTIFARRPFGVAASLSTFTPRVVALAQQMGIAHLLFVGHAPLEVEGVHTFVLPNQELGVLAAQHLLECGYRHLAIVQPEGEIPPQAFIQRLAGMQTVLAAQASGKLEILPLARSVASAHALVDVVFAQAKLPLGIYTFNDERALFLLGALARRGIHVPEEVGLVGTDNLLLGQASYPALTTIQFDAVDLGKRIIHLFHLLQHGLPIPEELTRPFIPSLIRRESTRLL